MCENNIINKNKAFNKIRTKNDEIALILNQNLYCAYLTEMRSVRGFENLNRTESNRAERKVFENSINEGTFSTIQSLLSSDPVHEVDPSEI